MESKNQKLFQIPMPEISAVNLACLFLILSLIDMGF